MPKLPKVEQFAADTLKAYEADGRAGAAIIVAFAARSLSEPDWDAYTRTLRDAGLTF